MPFTTKSSAQGKISVSKWFNGFFGVVWKSIANVFVSEKAVKLTFISTFGSGIINSWDVIHSFIVQCKIYALLVCRFSFCKTTQWALFAGYVRYPCPVVLYLLQMAIFFFQGRKKVASYFTCTDAFALASHTQSSSCLRCFASIHMTSFNNFHLSLSRLLI